VAPRHTAQVGPEEATTSERSASGETLGSTSRRDMGISLYVLVSSIGWLKSAAIRPSQPAPVDTTGKLRCGVVNVVAVSGRGRPGRRRGDNGVFHEGLATGPRWRPPGPERLPLIDEPDHATRSGAESRPRWHVGSRTEDGLLLGGNRLAAHSGDLVLDRLPRQRRHEWNALAVRLAELQHAPSTDAAAGPELEATARARIRSVG